MNIIDINAFTSEQKEALRLQFYAEAKAEAEAKQAEKDTYKDLVDKTVLECIKELENVSNIILTAKNNVFNSFETIIDLKSELYSVRAGQQSHSFTSKDGMQTITLGHRVNEGWDDTVNEGVEKVKHYIASLANDDKTRMMVGAILNLLSKDKKGNMKANKVLELEKMANESGDPGFLEGISIIKASFKPTPTCKFVDVRRKNEHGQWIGLPLSFSSSN